MTIPRFSPERLEAIRAGLMSTVRAERWCRLPICAAVATFVAAGALTGGAVSAAAIGVQSTHQVAPFRIGSTAGLRGVPALPGTIPGTPIVATLGSARSSEITSSGSVELASAPSGATDIRVSVTCLSPGHISWGTGQGNPSVSCAESDIGSISAASYLDGQIQTGADRLEVMATGDWILTYQYLRKVETAWGVNSHGQTFGVEKPDAGSPDLVSVDGVDASGHLVHGYALASQLQNPPGQVQPTSPREARTGTPNARTQIPVYKSNGQTLIGEFDVG